jgi:predicted RNase H-like nuclease (RuvC/YqgF family)
LGVPAEQRPVESADTKQKHPLAVQKGRLRAAAQVINRLSEEKGSLQDGIRALQQILEEFGGKERSLGGRTGISISALVEGLQGIVNANDVQNL